MNAVWESGNGESAKTGDEELKGDGQEKTRVEEWLRASKENEKKGERWRRLRKERKGEVGIGERKRDRRSACVFGSRSHKRNCKVKLSE